MAKTFRFDPEDDFGGDNLRTISKKELKAQRKARRRDEQALDDQMQAEDDGATSKPAW